MDAPSPQVLAAFGLSGTPAALPGGQGSSYRAGDAVLKPAEPGPGVAQWLAETTNTLARRAEEAEKAEKADTTERAERAGKTEKADEAAPERRGGLFRVARPLRTTDTGAWVHEGWTASRLVAGEEAVSVSSAKPIPTDMWLTVIEAGRAFHRALTGMPRPGFLAHRRHWWAVADRVAWQELSPVVVPCLRDPYERLAALLDAPSPAMAAASQLVHGDLTGNVLLAPGLPPAVIDFSPYWRPPAYAEAVVVADAMIWHGADAGLLAAAAAARPGGERARQPGAERTRQRDAEFVQFVARAVLFRLATSNERLRSLPGAHSASDPVAEDGEIRAFHEAAAAVAESAGSRRNHGPLPPRRTPR